MSEWNEVTGRAPNWNEGDVIPEPRPVRIFEPPTGTLPERALAALRAQQTTAQERQREAAENERLRRLTAFRSILSHVLGLDLTPTEEHVEIDGVRLAYQRWAYGDGHEIDGVWLTVPCPKCNRGLLTEPVWARAGGELTGLADLGARLEEVEAGTAHLACDACIERERAEERVSGAATPKFGTRLSVSDRLLDALAEWVAGEHALWHEGDQ